MFVSVPAVKSAKSATSTLAGLLPWQSLFLAFAAGIMAFHAPIPAAIFLVTFVVADTLFRGGSRRLPLLAFAICSAFGFGYAAQRAPEPVKTPDWVLAARPLMVRGVVDRVEPREAGRLRLVLRDIVCLTRDGEAGLAGGLAWTWRNPDYDPLPGQTVEARLRLVPVSGFGNPGSWDYQWYWQRQGVHWRGWISGKQSIVWGERPVGTFGGLKSALRQAVADRLPETPGGGVVLALVTGDRSGISLETADAVRAAGLAHTLALSGLHVGFVAAMGLALAWLAGFVHPPLLLRIPRQKLAVLLAAPLVLGYVWLGQPSSSLIRAATMYGFWGILLFQGRGRILLDGLFFALAVIVIVSPMAVFDLSLQMSAVAVAGIGLMYPRIRPLLFGGRNFPGRVAGAAAGVLAVSLCATVSLLPLGSWYFGSLSPNLLFNVVWIPMLGFAIMPLGLAGMILSPFAFTAPAGGMLLKLAAGMTDHMLGLLHMAAGAGLTPVVAVLRPLWPEVVGFFLLLVVALAAWANRRVSTGLAGLGFLLLAAPHVFVMASDARDEVRLTVLDVGLGQSALISLPGGHRWLVDGGGGSKSFDLGEAVVGPYLTMGRPPRLDGVFMSHPDSDHSRGLSFILARFQVDAFYTNGQLPTGVSGVEMADALTVSGLKPMPLVTGQRVALGDDVGLEVLHPPPGFESSNTNERSLVLRLVRGSKGLAILPGDMESAGADAVLSLDVPLAAEVLVLPHHGSKASLSVPFYRAVGARAALCSNGFMNRFNFPHPAVVEALDVPLFTTSDHGQITAVWSGDEPVAIRAYRP
jgi:competence protein ComEC